MKITLNTVCNKVSAIKQKGEQYGKQGVQYIRNFDVQSATRNLSEKVESRAKTLSESKFAEKVYTTAKEVKDEIINQKNKIENSQKWKDAKTEIKKSFEFYKESFKNLADKIKEKTNK